MIDKETVKTYLTGREITNANDLPIQFSERTGTDVFCTILTSIFAVLMLVIAIVQFNAENLRNMTYPTDGQGRKCTFDNPKFNYLYFTSITDSTKRVCVAQCPRGTEKSLQCWPTNQISCAANSDPKYQVQIYASTPKQTKLGLFCMPDDPKLKSKILQISQLKDRFQFIAYQKSLFISLGAAFLLGIIYLILLKFVTRPMVFAAIALGSLSSIASSIFIIIFLKQFNKQFVPWLIIVCIILIIFGVFMLLALIFKRKDIQLCAEYIHESMNILTKQPTLLLLIPVFIIFMLGLLVLGGFQIFAYESHSKLVFHKQNIYFQPSGTFIELLKILGIIQIVWGFFFLKQAFAFIVAGCAVTNHFKGDSYITFGIKGLLKYHWGSVIAGSFLVNFLFVPDTIYDMLKPSEEKKSRGHWFYKVCCCCDRVLGFVRSQSMGFMNMVGLPYCNSSRWCEKISYHSHYFEGSQSINRYFRVSSHAFLALLATLIGFANQISSGNVHPVGLIFSFLLNFFVVTYFICLAADLAETSLICRMTEHYINNADDMKPGNYKGNRKNQIRQSDVNDGYEVLQTSPT